MRLPCIGGWRVLAIVVKSAYMYPVWLVAKSPSIVDTFIVELILFGILGFKPSPTPI